MRSVSPDLIAHAVIASARVYGDCPARACTSAQRHERRCLTAAALGLADATHEPEARFARILGINPHSITTAKRRGVHLFQIAAGGAAYRAWVFLNARGRGGRA